MKQNYKKSFKKPEPSENSGQTELKQIIKAEHVKIMIDFPDENWQDFDEMYNGAGGVFLNRVVAASFPSSRSQEKEIEKLKAEKAELLKELKCYHESFKSYYADYAGNNPDMIAIDQLIERIESGLNK